MTEVPLKKICYRSMGERVPQSQLKSKDIVNGFEVGQVSVGRSLPV